MTTTPTSSREDNGVPMNEGKAEAVSGQGFSWWFGLSALLIGLDQWTKHKIVDVFKYGDLYPVTSFFNLTRLHNEGAAFGFLANSGGWQKYFFLTLAFAVAAFIARWLFKLPQSNTKLLSGGLAFILAGALGNAIDRLQHGYVVDFLDFYYGSFHWPAFNVADSCIFIGAMMVIADLFIHGERKI